MKCSEFIRYEVDHGCYWKKLSSTYIILVLNIDVVLIGGSNMQKTDENKMWLTVAFNVMKQGAAKLKNILSMVQMNELRCLQLKSRR